MNASTKPRTSNLINMVLIEQGIFLRPTNMKLDILGSSESLMISTQIVVSRALLVMMIKKDKNMHLCHKLKQLKFKKKSKNNK